MSHRVSMVRDSHQLARRASTVSAFFIEDSSPMFTYSSDDWTTGYAAQPSGYDQTLHMTDKSGSRVSFNVAATSLTLLVPAFDNCTTVISINSSSPITACSTRQGDTDVPFSLYSLPLGTHSVVWDTGNVPPDTQVVFWGIDGTRPVDPAGHVNVTIDDTFTQSKDGSVKLGYQGNWQRLRNGVDTDLGEKDSLDRYFNKTVAVATERGSSVGFTGKGSAVYLYGNVGPDYGSATISLNDEVAESSINLTSPWPMPYELLWYRTGLDPTNPTEVLMTNLADSKMSLDFVLFTTDPDTIASLSGPSGHDSADGFADTLAGKVVLFFLIPAVAITLLAFAMFMLFRRRRKQQALAQQHEQHQRQYSQSTDAEFKFPHISGEGDRWSDEPKSSRYSSHSEPSEADLVFVSYDEGKGQRMSEHWNKAATSSAVSSTSETAWNHEEQVTTPRSGRSRASRSPPMELRSLPQSVRASTAAGHPSLLSPDDAGAASGSEQYHGEDEQSDTQSTWRQPFRSILSPRYPSSVTPTSRRGTLPAYTLDSDAPPLPTPPHSASAMGTENASTYTSADIEKRLLQSAYSGYNTPASSQANSPISPDDAEVGGRTTPGPSQKRMTHQTHTSNAPSIMSVFGSPPSEARRSVAPTPAPRNSLPRPLSKIDMAFLTKRKPVPSAELSYPASPASTSKLPYPMSPESTRVHPKSSTTATEYNTKASLPPPTSFQTIPPSEDEGDAAESGHRRKKSLGGISARTDISAARPDSVIIPFEDFVQGLDPVDRSRVTSPIENDCFGPVKGAERRASPFDDEPMRD